LPASPISEKILKRFYDRFKNVRRTSGTTGYDSAMLNTIAEIVLVSMGIIDQQLFSLQSFNQDRDYYESLRDDFEKNDLDLDKNFASLRLKSQR